MKWVGSLVIALLFASQPAPVSAQSGSGSAPPCTVTANVDVRSGLPMLPGEPLDLNLRIRNPAASAIQFYRPSEQTGSVRLFFNSDSSATFKKYQGPMWGMADSVVFPKTLAGKASYDLPLRVLHQVWREPFLFNTAGTYRVKLTYQDGLACQQELETQTITVKVTAPTGNDLVVWNAIKDCVGCAYFLHTGVVRSTQSSQNAVVLLRSLAKQYPKSRYAKLFRTQLDALDDKSRDDDKDKDHKHDD